MKRLIGLLLIHSTNVGEGPSSPLDYFKFHPIRENGRGQLRSKGSGVRSYVHQVLWDAGRDRLVLERQVAGRHAQGQAEQGVSEYLPEGQPGLP